MNPAPYEALFKKKRPGTYLDTLIAVREALNELPDSATTFNPSVKMDKENVRILQTNPQIGFLAETWPVPGWYPGGSDKKRSRFVNPRARFACEYALIGVECECGEVITNVNPTIPVAEYHGEGCSSSDRGELRRELKKRRQRHLVRAANYNWDSKYTAASMCLERRGLHRVVPEGVCWNDLRNLGRRRLFETWRQLVEEGEDPGDIAFAFDYCEDYVREVLGERSKTAAANPIPA